MAWEFEWLDALQEIHNPILNAIMSFLSLLGDNGILWISLSVLLIIIARTRKCGIQMAVAMIITFIIGNLILKNLVARARPCWIRPEIVLLVKRPWDYSFPSGHSMNGFSAAVTILFYNKSWGVAAVVLAGLIAFSRLYNYVHFPTDVFTGILLGTFAACVTNWFFHRKADM